MKKSKLWKLFSTQRALRWFCIALLLILISGIGASAFESNGYTVSVKDYKMTWAEMAQATRENAQSYGKDVVVTYDGSNGSTDMTASTKQLSFKLLVPSNATTENPVPGIICVHGFYNNKEMQDAYYVELARRGFAVAVLDMAGHGSSDVTFDPSANIISATDNSGMEPVLEWLMSQPYVDETRMGITGHSQGGRTCGWLMQHLMRAGHGDYVKAYLGQSNSAGLTAILDEFGEFPETLTTGTIMCQYDEFSIVRDNSYDYLHTDQAKTLIQASYPDFNDDAVVAGQFYTQDGPVTVDYANGETLGTRASVIYWPNIIHPWAHFSSRCVGYAIEFFYSSLGIPAGAEFLSTGSQIWQFKELFNLIGLVGFFLLIVPFVDLLLSVPVFKSLRKGTAAADERLPAYKGAKVIVPFWVNGLLIAAISAIIFQPIFSGYRFGNNLFPTTQLFPQTSTNTLGMWTAACGIASLGLLLIFWGIRAFLNRKDPNYKENPFAIADLSGMREFLKAVLLAFTVIFGLYLIVNLQYLVWGTDFRIWVLAVLPFEFNKVGTMLRYMPFFLIFYVINSLCNANNRFKGMKEWKSLALTCLFNVLGLIVIVFLQYYSMVATGQQAIWMFEDPSVMFAVSASLGYILLFPIIPILIITNIIARKIYLKTGSIWVGGLLNGMLCTIIICANTFTQLSYVLT